MSISSLIQFCVIFIHLQFNKSLFLLTLKKNLHDVGGKTCHTAAYIYSMQTRLPHRISPTWKPCDFILIFQVNHFLIAICCSFIGCIVSIDLHPILIHQIKLLLQLIYYLFSLNVLNSHGIKCLFQCKLQIFHKIIY